MILNFIQWNVSPEIIHIGGLSVRWYGLLFALGFYVGYLIMERFFKKEGVPLPILDKLAMYMIISTVIGARLGHCLFYESDYYLSNPIEILYIWHGGLASHGAAIGILFALFMFSRKTKKSYWWVLDRIVIVTALAGLFIRTGNLMNSEIYGHATNLPWGFIFVRDDKMLIPRHPTQIYEGLCYLILSLSLLWIYYKKDGKPLQGMIFGIFLIALFSVRFLLEFLKETQVDFEKSMPLNMGQLLSLPFILAGIIILILSLKRKLEPKNSVENVSAEN
ncbi:MAG: prolipoprotein diacylglyceryl transferase [Bacteroidetes bacterium]|nr:prolipoprotein diacylglyceryl transferase [Bacteroidota bacterium]